MGEISEVAMLGPLTALLIAMRKKAVQRVVQTLKKGEATHFSHADMFPPTPSCLVSDDSTSQPSPPNVERERRLLKWVHKKRSAPIGEGVDSDDAQPRLKLSFSCRESWRFYRDRPF